MDIKQAIVEIDKKRASLWELRKISKEVVERRDKSELRSQIIRLSFLAVNSVFFLAMSLMLRDQDLFSVLLSLGSVSFLIFIFINIPKLSRLRKTCSGETWVECVTGFLRSYRSKDMVAVKEVIDFLSSNDWSTEDNKKRFLDWRKAEIALLSRSRKMAVELAQEFAGYEDKDDVLCSDDMDDGTEEESGCCGNEPEEIDIVIASTKSKNSEVEKIDSELKASALRALGKESGSNQSVIESLREKDNTDLSTENKTVLVEQQQKGG